EVGEVGRVGVHPRGEDMAMRVAGSCVCALVLGGLAAGSIDAQTPPTPGDATVSSTDVAVGQTRERGVAIRFLRDVGGDYKHFFSIDTGRWLSAGADSALGMHAADVTFRDATQG